MADLEEADRRDAPRLHHALDRDRHRVVERAGARMRRVRQPGGLNSPAQQRWIASSTASTPLTHRYVSYWPVELSAAASSRVALERRRPAGRRRPAVRRADRTPRGRLLDRGWELRPQHLFAQPFEIAGSQAVVQAGRGQERPPCAGGHGEARRNGQPGLNHVGKARRLAARSGVARGRIVELGDHSRIVSGPAGP